MTLAQARELIGEKVVYRSPAGVEEGVITSVSARFVFVRYGADVGSKATAPEQLEALR